MVIVDTTVWIDYFRAISNPETEWLDDELGRRRLALTDVILCEVLQGVRDGFDVDLVEFDIAPGLFVAHAYKFNDSTSTFIVPSA
mgnify:CR=1 FL=1